MRLKFLTLFMTASLIASASCGDAEAKGAKKKRGKCEPGLLEAQAKEKPAAPKKSGTAAPTRAPDEAQSDADGALTGSDALRAALREFERRLGVARHKDEKPASKASVPSASSRSTNVWGSDTYKYRDSRSSSDWKAKREEKVSKLREVLSAGGTKADYATDLIRAVLTRDLCRKQTCVALLFGNAFEEPSPELVQRYVQFARAVGDRGMVVVYDADSKVAPMLREALADRAGLGITAHPIANGADSNGLITIANPFLRLETFGSARDVIVSPESLLAQGLLIEDKVSHLFPSSEEGLKEWLGGFTSWAWSASKFGLGIRGPYKKIRAVEQATPAEKPQPLRLKRDFGGASHIEEFLQQAESYAVEKVLDFSKVMAGATEQMGQAGGAVVFGSSSIVPDFVNLVYGTARVLAEQGVPIATGGSGGMMEVANAAAFDAGAASIGIPLSYSSRIESEKVDAVSRHTATVHAPGYEARIPLLLHNRGIVMLAPGGRGTMSELAVTWAVLAGQSSISQELVFVSSEYYGQLAGYIRNSRLPDELKSSVHVVDSPQEIQNVVAQLSARPGFSEARFRSLEPVRPRNENSEFSMPTRGRDKPGLFGDWF